MNIYEEEFTKLRDWAKLHTSNEGNVVDTILAEADNRKTVVENLTAEVAKYKPTKDDMRSGATPLDLVESINTNKPAEVVEDE